MSVEWLDIKEKLLSRQNRTDMEMLGWDQEAGIMRYKKTFCSPLIMWCLIT